jgi:hypothetical protein
MSKATESSKSTRVGGAVLGASATLRVFGNTLDPSEITQLLGQVPTSSYLAGDPVSQRVTAKRKMGMWRLESSLSRTEPLSRHVTALLARLPSDSTIWSKIHGRFSADIYCGVDVNVPNSGMSLTSEAIEALAVRKLSVEFDFYALPKEDAKSQGE